MTREQLEKANQIKKELDEMKQTLSAIESSVYNRKRYLDRNQSGFHHEWLNSLFASFKFRSKDRAALSVHYEFSSPIEFNVDEEFVDMVHAYFKRKMTEKEEELKAI